MTEVDYIVELPGGGRLTLRNADEVELWETSAQRYIDDYRITKLNDLVLVGAILTQQLAMYRAQLKLTEDDKDASAAQGRIIKAAEEIRNLEKALGIDKKSRESGGEHTTANYVQTLKKAAHAKGIRIAARVKAYEKFMMELRWKVRLLRNGDQEDRNYHGLSDKKLIEWVEAELATLEEKDKEWLRDKGAVFVGRL